MISIRSNITDRLKPEPLYLAYGDSLSRLYNPLNKRVATDDNGGWAEPSIDDGDLYENIFKISNYYVSDCYGDNVFGDKVFVGNTYIGEYGGIDRGGNFIFNDKFGTKDVYHIKDWVLTDNHERGLHLEKRHKT